jgi:hypothetical protein
LKFLLLSKRHYKNQSSQTSHRRQKNNHHCKITRKLVIQKEQFFVCGLYPFYEWNATILILVLPHPADGSVVLAAVGLEQLERSYSRIKLCRQTKVRLGVGLNFEKSEVCCNRLKPVLKLKVSILVSNGRKKKIVLES